MITPIFFDSFSILNKNTILNNKNGIFINIFLKNQSRSSSGYSVRSKLSINFVVKFPARKLGSRISLR